MRLKGSSRGKSIRILIDNGATHNFIDIETAKLLGCKLVESKPFSVTVAEGNMLRSQYKCTAFVMHGVEFTAYVMTLPWGTCDLVLRIQWLATLGDIISNYQELKMEFNYGGKKVMLRGLHQNNVKVVSNKKLNKILQNPSQITYQCIGTMQECEEYGRAEGESATIEASFQSLPPNRSHDHIIHLEG
ncbi:PREDICTED: uncharacterized protein LOC105966915 [Erythranthe guttata]|uniref:uncharacterized protein LOC105966915 n=1 Tax=Erythranthe guttata TaxID=4155 RepID=UPI00064DEE9B|nr:PREDICTED: uncharacterized protein LOC105966915 [Erythranthe guttata]|eukprot:XP_012846944.1 PREDICTED: uncharacterized protein LOC105966915 [Erythranthe guttata]